MRDVTDGDLDRRIPAVGPRDIAELGGDAELMRRRIVAELDSARRAEQALRSQGAIVSRAARRARPHRARSCRQPVDGRRVRAGQGCAGRRLVRRALSGRRHAWRCASSTCPATARRLGCSRCRRRTSCWPGRGSCSSPARCWLDGAGAGRHRRQLPHLLRRAHRPRDGACAWASAGHLPTLLTHAGACGGTGPDGAVAGSPARHMADGAHRLGPGAVLVAYTDGVTETRGPTTRSSAKSGCAPSLPHAPASIRQRSSAPAWTLCTTSPRTRSTTT